MGAYYPQNTNRYMELGSQEMVSQYLDVNLRHAHADGRPGVGSSYQKESSNASGPTAWTKAVQKVQGKMNGSVLSKSPLFTRL